MEGKARFFFVAHMFQTRNPISKVPKRPNFMRATRIPCYSSKWLGQFWCFFHVFPSEMVSQFLDTFYFLLFLQVSFKTSKVDDYYIYSYVFEEDLKWHQFFSTCDLCILHKGTLSSLWNCLKMLAVGTLVPKCQKLNMFVSNPFRSTQTMETGQVGPFHDACVLCFWWVSGAWLKTGDLR